MSYLNTILINITGETIALLFLIAIYVSCKMQKSRKELNRPYLIMLMLTVGLLTEQICSWIVDYNIAVIKTNDGLILLSKILLIIDFGLYYLISIVMMVYIFALIQSVRDLDEAYKQKIHRFFSYIKISGIVLILIYIFGSFFDLFFYYDMEGYLRYHLSYALVLVAIAIPVMISLYFIIMNRKYLKENTWILMSYIYIPLLLIPIDVIFDVSTSCIALVLILLIMYLRIDLGYEKEIMHQEVLIAKHEKEMALMQMNLIMNQIQPHFLFNTLASISYLCTENPGEAAVATREFSNYLKQNMKGLNETETIPFEEEMQHLQSYLKIQGYRFAERMRIEYDIKVQNFMIPPLTLQPIVENSIKYGVSKRTEPTTITISTRKTKDGFEICIQDDGPGFDLEEPLKTDRPHIGMKATKHRVEEMAGGSIETKSEIGKGTITIIHIPAEMEFCDE